METVQDALVNLLVTVTVGVIGLVGAYTTVYLNKLTVNIKSKTNKIENEIQKALIQSAIDRVNDLVFVNVVKAQETLVKEILEKTEDGIFDKSDLKAVADVVKNDVIKQMGEQVTELVKVEIDDLEGYISAVIEKTLAELKGQA